MDLAVPRLNPDGWCGNDAALILSMDGIVRVFAQSAERMTASPVTRMVHAGRLLSMRKDAFIRIINDETKT